MKKILLMMILLLMVSLIFAQTRNEDEPLKGEWDFQMQKVWEIANAVSIPVVGIGGISSADDARKFFLAGATAIQVGTALYSDPELPERIVDALTEHPEWLRSYRAR